MKSFFFMSSILIMALTVSCTKNKDQPPIVKEITTDSTLKTERGVTYNNGQPFTGKAFTLNAQMDTVVIDFYLDGKLHGVSRSWYASGKRMQERLYQNGRKEGIHQGWWPNGKMKFQYEFKNDEYEGSVKEWYENGVPYKHFTYSSGQEEGAQKMWKLDGKIYANYIVKNNRIYGLSGRKLCKSLRKV